MENSPPPSMAHLLHFWTLISIELSWRNISFLYSGLCFCSLSPEKSWFCAITASDSLLPLHSTVFFEFFFLFISYSFFLPFWESPWFSALARVGLTPQPQWARSVHLASGWSRQQICSYTATGTLSGYLFYCFRTKTFFFFPSPPRKMTFWTVLKQLMLFYWYW